MAHTYPGNTYLGNCSNNLNYWKPIIHTANPDIFYLYVRDSTYLGFLVNFYLGVKYKQLDETCI